MNQQFSVKLVNYQLKAIWIILVVSTVVIVIPIILGAFVKNLSVFWFIALVSGYFYFLIWFGK